MKKLIHFLLASFFVSLLLACGQTGPLTLPPAENTADEKPSNK